MPKDKGNFAKLIKVRTRRSRKGVLLIVGFSKKDIEKLNNARTKRAAKTGKKAPQAVNTGGFYPIAVEFGTHDREPKAPMRNAFDSTAEGARDQCAREVRDQILQTAKR